MKVGVEQGELKGVGADLLAIGLAEGDELPGEIGAATGADAAKAGFKRLALLRPEGFPPTLVVGLGDREQLDAEKLRVAAAVAAKEGKRLGAASLAWGLPESGDDAAAAAALTTGTILAAYRFDRFKSEADDEAPRLESLTILGSAQLADAIEAARIVAEAQNRARDLQNTPANVATPSFLAARAEEIAAGSDSLSVDVLGRPDLE